ncbi:glycosyltransferase, partial [Salmonella enterica subsp. enterica serovar Cotham]|nr:glycosyltransferase [Salmonella enterica subsp. enterica serovar Cotham]
MRFIQTLQSVIYNDKDVHDKIRLIKELGSMLWANNIGIYSLNDVENKIINEVSKKYCPSKIVRSKKNVFVITIGYLSGGHTRLMENLASMLNNECDLIITGNVELEVKNRLNNYFNEIFEIATYEKNDLNEIYKLSDLLSNYFNIILNIHPDDIQSVIAAGLAKKNANSCIHFINHADHVFSFGATVADIWYQISEFGARLDELRELSGKTSFLGIPIAKINKKNAQLSHLKESEVQFIITSGSANKFKPQKTYSLVKKVPDLLIQFPNAKLIIVGTNIIFGYWWWWVYLKFRSRMKFYQTLAYADYLALMDKADIFLDSYPIPGGTAFVEQYLSGKRCAGYISPQQGYTPLERIKCEITCGKIIFNDVKGIDEKIEYIHSYEKVKNRFLTAINSKEITKINWRDYYNWSGDTTFFIDDNIREIPSVILRECI